MTSITPHSCPPKGCTRKGFYVLSVVLIYGLLSAVPLYSDWLTDPVNGTQVWADNPQPGDVISWSGGARDGLADGSGVLSLFNDGELLFRFEGLMVEGKAQGEGQLALKTESGGYALYLGEFKNSRMDGKGKALMPDGSQAEGSFKTGDMNGYITYIEIDGDRYEGEVKDNLPHGLGYQVIDENEEYYGSFVEGVRHGEGTLLYANGDIYKGEFRDGQPEGPGILTLVEGSTLTGSFKGGNPEGTFSFQTVEGEEGTAHFVNGKLDGEVSYTTATGEKTVETWQNGKKVNP